MKRQMQKGFTLIELMIVVAIIAILAAITIPAYDQYVDNSKSGRAQSNYANAVRDLKAAQAAILAGDSTAVSDSVSSLTGLTGISAGTGCAATGTDYEVIIDNTTTAGSPVVYRCPEASATAVESTTIYEKIMLDMREEVATGQSLQNAMSQHKRFPHLMNQMVAIGEESGALDTMLGKVADFYEEEVDNTVDALSSLFEPLIMVVIGTIVGGLVIALYLPIFQMGKVVGG